jgi:DNA polymerase-3 subunit delta
MGDPARDARSGTLAPIYLLVSTQPLLLERTVAAIRDAAVEPATRAFNYDVVDGKGGNASRILATLQTLPMMAKRRMVLIREITAMSAGELSQLIPYLSDPNPSTVLVATATKLDKRIKFFATAKRQKVIHDLEPPRRLDSWIKEEAERRRVQMRPAAMRRLADAVGKDLSRLALSLDQLALYAGDRPIEVDDVEDLIADTRERSVFELTDAIGAGDNARALEAVAALCDQRQSAIGVVAMLARHMRQVGAALEGMSERLSNREMAKRIGAPPFAVDKITRQARRYSPPSVARALAILSELDRALKGGRGYTKTLGRDLSERVALDRVVGELIGLAD